ncbi:MAG: sigma-70 family RNA polymerase sigma factor [bacterium]
MDIVDRYEIQMTRYIRRMIGDEHEINEDIAQEVFIKAYRSLHGYNPKLKFSSWIYRIAHNLCVDYLRKNSKKNHTSLDMEDDESQALIQKIASDEDVSRTISTHETRQAVQTIIASLPEKYKTVLILAFIEDKSYDEISDILEIPIGTV